MIHCIDTIIGISSVMDRSWAYSYNSTSGILYDTFNGWKKRAKKYKSGDIITIILNLKEREISFGVNNKSNGNTLYNVKVEENLSYRLAVRLGQNSKITILGFTKKYV